MAPQRVINTYEINGDTVKIFCYNRKSELSGVLTIDKEDFELCKNYTWYIVKNYASTRPPGKEPIKIHHLLLNHTPSKLLEIDHINTDGLDNRRCNLRLSTIAQNRYNRKKHIDNTSGYKGVYWNKQKNKWCANIQKNHTNYHLGFYSNLLDAAMAYNKAAKEIHGSFAILNKIPLIRRGNVKICTP